MNQLLVTMYEFVYFRKPPQLEAPLYHLKAGDQLQFKTWKKQGSSVEREVEKTIQCSLDDIQISLKLAGINVGCAILQSNSALHQILSQTNNPSGKVNRGRFEILI